MKLKVIKFPINRLYNTFQWNCRFKSYLWIYLYTTILHHF